MDDSQILMWIQSFGCGFRHTFDDRFCLDWLDKDGHVHTTTGINIKDATIGASLDRDKMYAPDLSKNPN